MWDATLPEASRRTRATRCQVAARARRGIIDRVKRGFDEIGHVDLLVANAGTSEGGFWRVFEVNVLGVHLTCEAAIDHDASRIVITAAHCVSGGAAGMVFVPGQHGAQAPYGRWTVTAASTGAPRAT